MGIRSKLIAFTVGIAVLAAVVFDGYVMKTLGAELGAQTEAELAVRTELVAASVARSPDLATEAAALAAALSERAGARVTLIDPSGVVRGDSSVAPERLGELEAHATRDEVADARHHGAGRSERVSKTTQMRMLYAARRLDRPDGPWVVRLAFEPIAIDRSLSAARARVVQGTLLALALAVSAALLGSRALSGRLVYLTGVAREMRGDLSRRARVQGSDEIAALGSALDDLAESLEHSRRELGGEGERFGAVLESMREGVLVIDEEGDISLVNPALSQLLGIRGDAVGRPPIEVLRSASLHELIEEVSLARAAATREIEIAPAAPGVAGPPGRRILVVNAAPLALPAQSRGPAGVVAVFFDVTELRRIEGLQRNFIANASHELRTPVASIRASSETLLGGALDDPEAARDFVEVIDRNAARLHRLVNDLLDLSRIEGRERPLSQGAIDLAAQAETAVALLRERAREKRTEVKVDVVPGTLVAADARALDQILTNLVDNAIHHTPDGSRVVVRARAANGRVVLDVEDNGPGIPPVHQGRVFERFYRIDPGRSRASGGTGLGLSIAKHLVEAMSGDIIVTNGAAGGALFRVTLPGATAGAQQR
ncbi:ATP-binding protein [Sorangium sp. So ce1389]|uniref:HAMP domain-containing sensor histidine kinase n=1 Tax=Sorangium sp. So ce1389 TaxID=3133336 RepID=UPI003F6288AA